jgi:arylsulfatase
MNECRFSIMKKYVFPVAGLVAAGAMTAMAQDVLPQPEAPYQGVANGTLAGSKPYYQPRVTAPKGAPNVLIILLDDVGFGQPSAFGGAVQMPTLDRLAGQGLRYNRFHVNSICSPTRASLLSGRNNHAIGIGAIVELGNGFPGYNAAWPKSAASVAETLRLNGYNTAAFGKWHLTPDDEQGPAGPFDRWPNALGFDYFWGFLPGEASQYRPVIVENNTILGVPADKNFYFPEAMTDKAIQWIRGQQSQAPGKPFLLYYSPGAMHAPHHVPEEWADKYKGKFDQGWDQYREETFARQKKLGVIPADAKLTARNEAFPLWETLPPEEKKLYARQMEVYAGFLEKTDYEIGRVVSAIGEMGIGDNTLIIYITGDNGASMEGTETGTFNEMTTINGVPITAEQQLALIERYGGLKVWGGPRTHPHYASAWAWAGNTPFQWGKQVASHLGGTRQGAVISWPGRIHDKGGLRSQYVHVIDVAPTILEVARISAPKVVNGVRQMPIHGVSFASTFDDPKAQEMRTQQYFESLGNRSMYKDGWILACRLDRNPWKLDPETLKRFAPGVWNPDKDRCELYNLDKDFSEADDLAAIYPEKVIELKDLFDKEADKYQVNPLLGGVAAAAYGFPTRMASTGRKRFTYYHGVENVLPGMQPPLGFGRSYSISADIEVPAEGFMRTEGVIVAAGSFLGGFSLYVEDGTLKHTYSFVGVKFDTLIAPDYLPEGKVNVRYQFTADKPGRAGSGGRTALFINGKEVAAGRLEHTVPLRFSAYEGMDIGKDNGAPVSPSYRNNMPFAFTGKIEKVVFNLEDNI